MTSTESATPTPPSRDHKALAQANLRRADHLTRQIDAITSRPRPDEPDPELGRLFAERRTAIKFAEVNTLAWIAEELSHMGLGR